MSRSSKENNKLISATDGITALRVVMRAGNGIIKPIGSIDKLDNDKFSTSAGNVVVNIVMV